jgi:hypothetical protein
VQALEHCACWQPQPAAVRAAHKGCGSRAEQGAWMHASPDIDDVDVQDLGLGQLLAVRHGPVMMRQGGERGGGAGGRGGLAWVWGGPAALWFPLARVELQPAGSCSSCRGERCGRVHVEPAARAACMVRARVGLVAAIGSRAPPTIWRRARSSGLGGRVNRTWRRLISCGCTWGRRWRGRGSPLRSKLLRATGGCPALERLEAVGNDNTA